MSEESASGSKSTAESSHSKEQEHTSKRRRSASIDNDALERSPNIEKCHCCFTIPPNSKKCYPFCLLSFFIHFVVFGTIASSLFFLKYVPEELHFEPFGPYVYPAVFISLNFLLHPLSCGLINCYHFSVVSTLGGLIASAGFIGAYMTFEKYYVLLCYAISGFGSSLILTAGGLLPSYLFTTIRGAVFLIASLGKPFGAVTFMGLTHYFSVSLKNWSYFLLMSGGMARMKVIVLIVLILVGYGIIACPSVLIFRLKAYTVEIRTSDMQNLPKKRVVFMADKVASDIASNTGLLRDSCYFKLFGSHINTNYPTASDIVAYRKHCIIYVDTEEELNYLTSLETSSGDLKIQIGLSSKGKDRPLFRTDAFYFRNLTQLKMYRTHGVLDYHLTVTRAISSRGYTEAFLECSCRRMSVNRVLATMLYVHILKTPSVCFFCLCMFLTQFFLPIIISTYPEQLRSQEKDMNWVIIAIFLFGLGDAAGLIASDKISRYPILTAGICHGLNFFLTGALVIMAYCIKSSILTLVTAFFIGIIIGSIDFLEGDVLLYTVGLQFLTSGKGILALFKSAAIISGTLTAGVFRQDFSVLFLISGACIWLAGIALVLTKMVVLLERKNAFTTE